MALTEQEQQNYLDKSGNYCPKCNSEHIRCDSLIQTDGTQAWRDIECAECDFMWVDIYTLTGVEEKS